MKSKTNKQKNPMSYRSPADMHADGVYFNEELLARKRKKELQKQKFNNKTTNP